MIFKILKYLIFFLVVYSLSGSLLLADINETSSKALESSIKATYAAQKDQEIDTNTALFLAGESVTIPNEKDTTLKDVVSISISANYRVKQAQERISQAEYGTQEASADFLPQVDLSVAGLNKRSKGFDEQKYNQGKGDLALTYNLYSSGMHVANVERTQITKLEQENRLKGTIEEEVLKVIDAYFSVVYGRRSLEVNKSNYDKLLKVLEIVKIKRQLGAATLGDENSILASVSNAKTAFINTESAYNNAKDYYQFLTGASIETLNPYETEFDVKVKPFGELFEEIKQGNTDLNLINTQIKGKQKDVEVNNATNGLKIDLSITNSQRNKDDFYAPKADRTNRDFSAELIFSYNLYNGGRTEAKAAKLMSEVSGLVYNLEYTTKDTKWNSQKLFNSVQTNSKTIDTLSTEIGASKKMADAYWEKFRLSSQDLVTLLQAQRQVNSAELEKLRSEKTRLIDYFNLLTKQGKLLEYFNLQN